MGTYGSAQNVTLTCNDGSGSGCATTYYCLGTSCTPNAPYTGPVTVSSTTSLSFYSTDLDGNSEQVRTYAYTIDPTLPYHFDRQWPELPQPWHFRGYPFAFDTNGNTYVSDSTNNRIKKFDANGYFVTSWGSYGSGDGQFSNPYGIVVDATGNVYVADVNNHRIQKFSSTGVFLTKWGTNGSGNGQLYWPKGIALDSAGNVYVTDTQNNRIQKFSSDGTFITKWGSTGTATGQFNNPNGIAIDSSGDVYVTEINNNRVQKFNSSGTFLLAWGASGSGNGQFSNPYGIAVDSTANVYVADTNNSRIQKFTSEGTFITKWSPASGGSVTSWIGINPVDILYVAAGPIQKFTTSGVFISSLTTSDSAPGRFNGANGIAADAFGNVYVADTYNYRVQKFGVDGLYKTSWGTVGSSNGQFSLPESIAVDSTGNVFVADQGNSRIQKFTPSGSYLSSWGSYGSGNGQLKSPYGVAVSSAGEIYVADTGNNRIQKFGTNGTFVTSWGASGSNIGQFSSPYGIAVDSSGNVYVVDGSNNRVQKFDANGTFITTWGTYGSGTGQFIGPRGISVDSSGNVFVADTFANRIQQFTSDGAFITTWGSKGNDIGQVIYPGDIGVDPSGNVYVVDTNNSRVQKFIPASALHTPGASTGMIATADNGQATVSFTAPASNGGSAITSFTVTSSPGNITATGTASPITVTGLTNGIAYTFTVTATNANGTGAASSPSNSVTPFLPTNYSLALTVTGSGTVHSSPTPDINCSDSCNQSYTGGTVVNLSASPATGFSFNGWSGSCSGTGSCTVTMDQARSVTASFADTTSPITIFSPAAGAYSSPQSVTLACSDSGSGCASTSYCLGSGCNPTLHYSGPIAIAVSTALRFYSRDIAGNSEGLTTVLYNIASTPITIRVPADQPTIQGAITTANNGDTVLVAPGTYLENINFHGKAITVRSEAGPGTTIIDGNQAGSVVIFASGETNASVLDGFTLRNGKPSGSISPYDGGGIYIASSSPVVANNKIINNTGCGGVGIYAYWSSAIIRSNVISNNIRSGCTGGGGGGVSLIGSGSAQIIGNEISNNSVASGGDGGGIYLNGAGTPLISNNIIRGNIAGGISPCASGGGILMINSSNAAIIQNVISQNSAGCGGGVYWSVPSGTRGPYLVNNTLVDNDGAIGSGVYANGYDINSLLVNNVIVGKTGQTAVYCGSSNDPNPPQMRFNIVHAPSGTTYGGICTEQNGINGNITADPLFYNDGAGKYYPMTGSPAIDNGDNGAPSLPASDLDANVRILDGNLDLVARVDMGALEFDPSLPVATIQGAPTGITTINSGSLAVGGNNVVAYRYRLDGGTYSAEADVASPIVLTALSDATHVVAVLGKNSAGSWQVVPTTVSWTVDTTPPTATVGGVPTSPTTSTGATLTVNGAGVVSYKFKFDAGSYSAEIPVATPISLTGLSEATHTVSVLGKDSAGNWQIVPTAVSWTVSLPPVTVFTTNPASPDGTNGWFVTRPTISLTGSEPGTTYYLWGTSTGYTYSTPSQSWLTGGTAQNVKGDDTGKSYTLPFGFSFYGTTYTSVNVSSNGLMRFDTADTSYSNSATSLKTKVAIAPLWDDLITGQRSGDDIYVFQPDQDSICFRWQSMTYGSSYDTNFEAVLYRDGRIRFNYGAQSGGLTPTIGISKGDGVTYHIAYDNNLSTTNYRQSILYTPANWNTYATAIVPSDGDTILSYYSVDLQGTSEQTTSRHVKVDTIPPTISAAPAGGTYGAGLSISLACSDSGGSGCGATYYCIGAGCAPTALYTGPIAIAGSTVLRFSGFDNAGNSQPLRTETYTLSAPAAPVALAADSVAPSSFTARWNSVSGATGYLLDVSTNSSFTTFLSGYAGFQVGNVTSYSVSGMSALTNYYYRVRASNAIGASAASNVIATTTAGVGTIDGSCGSANNSQQVGTPGTDLCLTGSPSDVSGIGPWTWTCAGSGGGSTASCSAVQAGGVFYKSSDGGATWVGRATGIGFNNPIRSLMPSPAYAADRTVFLGSDGGVYKSTDSGDSWVLVKSGYQVRALAISPAFATDRTLYAGFFLSGVSKSTDGGNTWVAASAGMSGSLVDVLVISPDFANDHTLFAGTSTGIYKSTDGGTSWSAANAGISGVYPFLAISPNYSADQTLSASTSSGDYKSTDGGTTWVSANSGAISPSRRFFSPAYASDHTLFSVNSNGIYKSTDSGGNWSTEMTPFTASSIVNMLLSPAYGSDQTIIAASYNNNVFRSGNGGASWTPSSSDFATVRQLSALGISPAFAGDRTVFAAGYFAGPQLSVSPGSVSFSNIQAGASATTSVTIANGQFGDANLAVNSIAISGTGASSFTVAPGSCGTPTPILPKNGQCTIDVTFTPTGTGAASATLQISSNAVMSPSASISLSGSGVTITSAITAPTTGTYTNATSVAVTGTATCNGGCTISLVEVSADGGATWQPASGTTSWSVNLALPVAATYAIKSRARTATGIVETPGAGITVTVERAPPSGTLALYYGVWTLNASANEAGIVCLMVYPNICGELQLSTNGVTWQPATTTPGTGGPLWLRDRAGNTSLLNGALANPNGGPIRVDGGSSTYFSLLQHAINAAGNGNIFRVNTARYTEDIVITVPAAFTIRGGYDNSFGVAAGTTTINGNFRVQAGAVTLENLELGGAMSIESGEVTADSMTIR